MADVVPDGPFPVLHCSISMVHQSKHVQQKKGTFGTTIQGICMNIWRKLGLLYIKKKKKKEFKLKWEQRKATKVIQELRVTNGMRLLDLGLFSLAKRKLGKNRITSPKYITQRLHTKEEEA